MPQCRPIDLSICLQSMILLIFCRKDGLGKAGTGMSTKDVSVAMIFFGYVLNAALFNKLPGSGGVWADT